MPQVRLCHSPRLPAGATGVQRVAEEGQRDGIWCSGWLPAQGNA